MSTRSYFQDELTFLRDLGEEFMAENPDLASFLSRQSSDPDVERLLEGFAFLTARLRQKLDDELPELTHSLLSVLWPHYLRPVPSCAMLELSTAGPQVALPRATPVEARPISGVRCLFQTCFDVNVLPLRIAEVGTETGSAGTILRLRIVNTAGQTCDRLDFDRLRLHFSAEREPIVSKTLFQWINRDLESAAIEADGRALALPAGCVAPVGFAPEQHVIPYPPSSFDGFRLLQEYFAFPSKFLFADLRGLAAIRGLPVSEFTVILRFSRPIPDRVRVGPQSIRLNCTPVINLFPHDAQPIIVNRLHAEYRVRASGANASSFGIYTVESAVGWGRGQRERTAYMPFESFGHTSRGTQGSYFRSRRRSAIVRGQPELYISFVDSAGAPLTLQDETVAMGLTCTNGRLAERVPAGSIDQVTAAIPAPITFRNITAVTGEIPPPIEGDGLGRLIANLARNFGSLADIRALRTLYQAYDFAALVDAQAQRRLELLLEGMLSIDVEPFDWIVRGMPVRGQRLVLRVAESKLGGEQDVFLFGAVLNEILSLYSGMNACHRLVIEGDESKVRLEWPIKFGNRPSI